MLDQCSSRESQPDRRMRLFLISAAKLKAIAEYITKTHAICMKCGQPANYSQRIFESEERVAVGAVGMYEARCRRCFVPHADSPTVHED